MEHYLHVHMSKEKHCILQDMCHEATPPLASWGVRHQLIERLTLNWRAVRPAIHRAAVRRNEKLERPFGPPYLIAFPFVYEEGAIDNDANDDDDDDDVIILGGGGGGAGAAAAPRVGGGAGAAARNAEQLRQQRITFDEGILDAHQNRNHRDLELQFQLEQRRLDNEQRRRHEDMRLQAELGRKARSSPSTGSSSGEDRKRRRHRKGHNQPQDERPRSPPPPGPPPPPPPAAAAAAA